MNGGNVEIVRRAWEAYERGDLGLMLETFAEDVVLVRDPELIDTGIYSGREGVLRSLFEWAESFDEFTQTPVELIDAGDRVLSHVRQRALGAQSGVPVELDLWFVVTLRDGKIVRFEIHTGKEDALRAAGLGE